MSTHKVAAAASKARRPFANIPGIRRQYRFRSMALSTAATVARMVDIPGLKQSGRVLRGLAVSLKAPKRIGATAQALIDRIDQTIFFITDSVNVAADTQDNERSHMKYLCRAQILVELNRQKEEIIVIKDRRYAGRLALQLDITDKLDLHEKKLSETQFYFMSSVLGRHFHQINLQPSFRHDNVPTTAALMSEGHVQLLLVNQQRKTEVHALSNGTGDSPAAVPNSVNGTITTGSHTPTSTGILEDRPINGTAVALVANGENGVLISAPAPAGPPPPYSEEPRRSRRPTVVSRDSDDEDEDEHDDAQEGTPLLRDHPRRRSRAASYSTMASYTGVDFISLILGTQPSTTTDPVPRSFRERRARYFVPVRRRVYWRSLAHLAVINFPFALAAWVLLFCGVVLGTTLLITLPFGVVFWFLTLYLSRSFARAELHLQSKFHRPLRVAPPDPPRPIFYRPRQPEDIERALVEPGTEVDVDPTIETSFLKNSYSMFMDPSSFQPIFYFLVVKASITLVVTPLVLALAPVCIILVLPAPAMLRVVRRVGAWQANLAIEALS